MTVAPASAGSFLISSATANPSIPGMCASRTTRGKAAPASLAFLHGGHRRPVHSSASTGFMSHRLERRLEDAAG